ncbi:MAG TPA: Gar1/Naf1 family protein [Nitrososphaeraceae archaeon]|nr:Gar1/Naf1 family protein [Nitrososphaeraceae archaeon]
MNELGEVMHLSNSGRLIVRLQKDGKQIKSGQLLVDANGKRIGKVIEVIGPVNAPYASVAPLTDRIKKIIGTNVFNGGVLAKRRDFRSHVRKQQKGFRRYNNLGENQQ